MLGGPGCVVEFGGGEGEIAGFAEAEGAVVGVEGAEFAHDEVEVGAQFFFGAQAGFAEAALGDVFEADVLSGEDFGEFVGDLFAFFEECFAVVFFLGVREFERCGGGGHGVMSLGLERVLGIFAAIGGGELEHEDEDVEDLL